MKPYRKNVGIVVFNANGQVLAGRRSDKPDVLQFPQGGIDAGETPLQAARRELREETTLDMTDEPPAFELDDWLAYDFPDWLDAKIARNYRGQQQKWFFFFWDGDVARLDLDRTHGEFDRLIWTDFATVLQSNLSFKQPVYEQVARRAQPAIQHFLSAGERR